MGFIKGGLTLPDKNHPPIVCCVKTELQVAIVAKKCQDYGIHSIIKIKPYIDISQLKKALRNKFQEMKYELCPCGTGKKFKFCCYEKEMAFDFLDQYS